MSVIGLVMHTIINIIIMPLFMPQMAFTLYNVSTFHFVHYEFSLFLFGLGYYYMNRLKFVLNILHLNVEC